MARIGMMKRKSLGQNEMRGFCAPHHPHLSFPQHRADPHPRVAVPGEKGSIDHLSHEAASSAHVWHIRRYRCHSVLQRTPS